jgi:hypothetical protein
MTEIFFIIFFINININDLDFGAANILINLGMGKGKVLGEEIMSLLRSCPMRPLVNYSGYNSVVA